MALTQSLLEDHERLKESREKKAREKAEKEAKRMAALQAMKEDEVKRPGFQRLRASQYDELRRQLATGGTTIPSSQVGAVRGLLQQCHEAGCFIGPIIHMHTRWFS